ncbi:MAG: CcmD family protein [Actinomycetota bacterium]|nr:CcmD family protein [Actinomycetota bacterium]
MTNLGWLFVAIMVVWVAIGAYLLSLGVRQHKLEARIAELDTAEERL